MITQREVKRLFKYVDGDLVRKIKTTNQTAVGDIVGSLDRKGYLITQINYKKYKNHRMIFLYHHGYLPKEIDHIDHNPSNNKIENLRAATRSQNQQNQHLPKNSTSGFKGVSWYKRYNKWRVQISCKGKKYHGGYFNHIENATQAAKLMRIRLHGEFVNHG